MKNMKRIIFQLSSLFIILLCIISLTNCRNGSGLNNRKNFPNLDYYICGLYFEVVDEHIPSLEYPDHNPSAYFDYTDQFFYVSSGNTGYYVKRSDQVRNVTEEGDTAKISLFCNFTFPSSFNKNQLNVYLICQNKDGSFFVDKDNSQIAKINKERCSFNTTFTCQKQKYQFNISIGLYKE